MKIDVAQVPLEEILPLRELYRQEMNCQIVHDSLPERGFGNLYLLRVDGRVAGYGFVMGYRGEPKDMIRERHLHGGGRVLSTAGVRQLSDPGVEEGVLRDGQDSRGAVQRHEYSLAGDTSKGRTAAMRPHFERYRSGEV